MLFFLLYQRLAITLQHTQNLLRQSFRESDTWSRATNLNLGAIQFLSQVSLVQRYWCY